MLAVNLVNDKAEQCVGTAANVVEARRGGLAAVRAFVEEINALLVGVHIGRDGALHVEVLGHVLLDLEVHLLGGEQITAFSIVELHVRHLHLEGAGRGLQLANLVEEIGDGLGHHSLETLHVEVTRHRVRLTGAGLAIGKDGSIVPLQHRLEEGLDLRQEDVAL